MDNNQQSNPQQNPQQQPPPYPPQAYAYPPHAEDEIDLRELFGILWTGRWLIIAVTLIAALISVLYALSQINIYRAEAILAEAGARQSTSPLAGQLGGAAALIGISLPMGQDSARVSNAIAVLQSRDFIIRFIHNHDVLVPLFAGQWDAETHSSTINTTIYNESTGEWLRENGAPTDLQAYRAFNGILSVNQDRITNLITVSIEWRDPVQAQYWVNQLVQDINQEVKAADLAEATNSIEYLRRQLDSTQLVEMKRVFYDLIESQTRVSMLADVRDEYVFQIVDPAIVPDQTVAPRRSLIAIIGTMAGGMLGLMLVLVSRIFRN